MKVKVKLSYITLVVGSSVIGLAILSLNAGSLIELTFVIMSTFNGPIFGLFLIGYFCPRCNVKGVWTGFITSIYNQDENKGNYFRFKYIYV
ncbi:hypothetical protein Anas_11431 [Armadillidium nasatum]|uniref:Uncharacterized protein n=1 Tax=Armadillidium nasatum TaxID=96803 RepID=A0A5N5TC47_9CRUS|nr:hypothetical protein Anas_11431 [Armadillidium nasatum]